MARLCQGRAIRVAVGGWRLARRPGRRPFPPAHGVWRRAGASWPAGRPCQSRAADKCCATWFLAAGGVAQAPATRRQLAPNLFYLSAGGVAAHQMSGAVVRGRGGARARAPKSSGARASVRPFLSRYAGAPLPVFCATGGRAHSHASHAGRALRERRRHATGASKLLAPVACNS